MKVCSKCGIEKELSDFCRKTSNKDGYDGTCRECKKKYMVIWSINNKQWRKKYNEEYREKNNKLLKERKRRYYQIPEVTEHRNEYNKKYRMEHRRELNLYLKDYYKKNREIHLEKMKKYLLEKNELINEQRRNHYANNKEIILSRNKEYRRTDNGRIASARHHHKRRKLGKNFLFENILDRCERQISHHINDNDCVWIPEDFHLLYPGRNVKSHRENLMHIIKQLYPKHDWDKIKRE